MTIPFDDITSFGQQTMLDRNVFNISWILGRFCNYNCSYCWPYARSDKIDYQDHTLYINSINKIKQQARANGFNAFQWSFSGGEPTAYKQLNDLVKHLDETESSYQSIHMTTNLSPGSKWWKTWCSNTDLLQRRSITASFHDEFAKEQEFGDKCLQLQYELMKTGFPQKVKDDEVYQVRLTDGLQNYFLDQAERFNAFNFNKFFGWHCNAGYQSLIIRGNEVKRGYSCHDTPLGTLSDGFEIFKTPVKCVTPSCVSSADSKIPKRK